MLERKTVLYDFDNNIVMKLTYPKNSNIHNYKKISKDHMLNSSTGELVEINKNVSSKFDMLKSCRQCMGRFIKIALANIPQNIPNVYFVTLTYFRNMNNQEILLKDEKNFLRNLRRNIPNVKYMLVRELQERGAYHLHLFIWSEQCINDIDSIIKNAWITEGNVDIQQVLGTEDFAIKLFYLTNLNPHSKNEKVLKKIERLKMFPAELRLSSWSRNLIKPKPTENNIDLSDYSTKFESDTTYGIKSELLFKKK